MAGCFVSRIVGRQPHVTPHAASNLRHVWKAVSLLVTFIQLWVRVSTRNTAAPAPRPPRDARDWRPHPRLSAGGRLKHHHQTPQPVAAKPVPTDHGARRTTLRSGRIGSRSDPMLFGRRGCRGSTSGTHLPRRLEHPRSPSAMRVGLQILLEMSSSARVVCREARPTSPTLSSYAATAVSLSGRLGSVNSSRCKATRSCADENASHLSR